MPQVSICKTFEFAASHRLCRPDWDEKENARVFGKCAHPAGHGHNYRMEVVVSGQPSAETGMVIDASRLEAIVDESLLVHLDHRNLNTDVAWLAGKVTTVENLTLACWDVLSSYFSAAEEHIRLKRITIWETSRIYASVEE